MAQSSKGDGSLLTPSHYDDDASSLHSVRSNQDTDSEDDEVLMEARTSGEVRLHDQSVLMEEEERDRLLEESRIQRGRRGSAIALPAPLKGLFRKASNPSTTIRNADEEKHKTERGRRRTVRRREKKERLMGEAEHGEAAELMHEMEEGGMKEGSATGDSSETDLGSDEIDQSGFRGLLDEKTRRTSQRRFSCLLYLLIAIAFCILLLLAWRLSLNRPKVKEQTYLSNGTALFAPTTILISLDGFRADFLQRGITPRLNELVAQGISPDYMLPSFPSVTFPNHYTIVTGLYPEAHGVVGNSFWDPQSEAQFYYTDSARSMQSHWWGGEPLWVTAEKQGIRTAIHMWPGSEAHIMEMEPTFLDKFNSTELLSNKVDRVLELLDKPGQESKKAAVVDMRPQFIAAYVPNVDADGHKYGPNSTEIRTTINQVDDMLDRLFVGLEERNLTNIINVVVVSDHGMASTSTDRMIQLDDLIDVSKIAHTDGWPLFGLRPKDPADLQGLYDTLSQHAAANDNIDVYLRDVNMPERYHFSHNDRIAPLWIVPRTGWAIALKSEFDVEQAKSLGTVYHPKGLHGYDHEHPLMRAIFVARGPAFPHKPNSRIEPFRE